MLNASKHLQRTLQDEYCLLRNFAVLGREEDANKTGKQTMRHETQDTRHEKARGTTRRDKKQKKKEKERKGKTRLGLVVRVGG